MPKTDMSIGGGVGGGGYGAFQGGHMSAHDMALGQATQQQQGHSLQLTNTQFPSLFLIKHTVILLFVYPYSISHC